MKMPSFCLESETSQSVALKAVNVVGLVNSTAALNSSRLLCYAVSLIDSILQQFPVS